MQQNADDTASSALSIALQNTEFSTDPRILCAAASTCKSCRSAMSQRSAGNTAVKLSLSAPLWRMHSFSRWLSMHALLVGSITLSQPDPVPWTVNGLPWKLHMKEAQQLLLQAMQLATAAPTPAANSQPLAARTPELALEAAHNAGAAAAAVQPRTRIPSISSFTTTGDLGMLAALPAHSLTQLHLQGLPQSLDVQAVAAAVACFSNLRRLRMEGVHHAGHLGLLAALPAHSLTHLQLKGLAASLDGQAVAAALSRFSSLQQLRFEDFAAPVSGLTSCLELSRLTSLELLGMGRSSGENFQQLLLLLARPLPLQALRLDVRTFEGTHQALDLSHLTQLSELRVTAFGMTDIIDVTLHSQLQQLQLDLACLFDVQHSDLQLQQRLLLSHVARLPFLQHLALKYSNTDLAVQAAAAWPLLPQLRELSITKIPASRWQLVAILNGVAACTNLTKLDLSPGPISSAGEWEHGSCPRSAASVPPWHMTVAGLTMLKDLSMRAPPSLLQLDDALALTVLTRLTRLVLKGAHSGAADRPATALAGSCRQLLHLELTYCCLAPGDALALTALTGLTALALAGVHDGVGDAAAVALASSLQQLRCLDLSSCSLDSMACLEHVRHLTQLTLLRIAHNGGCTQQGLMLLTGLRYLQGITVDTWSLTGSTDVMVTEKGVQSFWDAVKG